MQPALLSPANSMGVTIPPLGFSENKAAELELDCVSMIGVLDPGREGLGHRRGAMPAERS